MIRQINNVVKLTVPTIGNCATDQITAIASSTHRVGTLLTTKPTTMAEIENSRKNEEPSCPNCSGSSFSSVMIGTPARPTTILSAKFTSMNRNKRNVIFQAPLGVAAAVMVASPVLSLLDATRGFPGKATADFDAKCVHCTAVRLAARHNPITIASRLILRP